MKNESFEDDVIKRITDSMVFVEGNVLVMQTQNSSAFVRVSLPSFYISKFPVSNKEWNVVMCGNIIREDSNFPKVNVSWNDCQDFIERLNKLTGKRFRLPSIIEWEFAAFGGLQSHEYVYSGSNNPDEVAWYKTDNALQGSGIHEIALKKENELGLYDMSGNIWEWCQDNIPYHNNPYSSHLDIFKNNDKSHKAIKGGSAGSPVNLSKISYTYAQHPDYRGMYVGFRLAI